MSQTFDDAILRTKVYHLFRDFFDRAERRRRWSVRHDIPWDQCNPSLKPVVADVVETFCTVEMFLPDYLSKLLLQVRTDRGRAWFLANWGYEEAKHSLALEDWLLRSGQRNEEQIADLTNRVAAATWDPPYDTALGMICYTMMQELATFLHYRNLRRAVTELGGDPALDKILTLISVDERSHFDFFKRVVELYLEFDRPATLDRVRDVVNTFKMPAYNLMTDSAAHAARIKELKIFDDQIFFFEVYEPYLAALGLTRHDLRQPRSKKTAPLLARSEAV
jgi:acyl-[acyl-carrier-protein] desaturase